MIAVDTNLLVYAHRRDSIWHARASALLAELAEGRGRWAIPWPCLHELLAVVTHPRIFKPPTPLTAAIDQVDAWLESPSLALLERAPQHGRLCVPTSWQAALSARASMTRGSSPCARPMACASCGRLIGTSGASRESRYAIRWWRPPESGSGQPDEDRAVKLGDLDLWIVSDGEFRLDGGAMFGVVPKVMWEQVKPADERNRIRVCANCILVRRGSDLLLVDTGFGEKHDPKFEDQFGFEVGARRLPDAIRALGFELGDVTHVLLSHLHFDHAGWNTRLAGERVVPTFPKARYWLERGELAHAQAPNERDRASYDPRDWEPLLAAGVVGFRRRGGAGCRRARGQGARA